MKCIKKLAALSYFAAGFMLLFGRSAQAYIDPSIASYMIQAIAGIVIGVGAVVGIYWRRARRKINNKLGVDENRNKEVESDDIQIKED